MVVFRQFYVYCDCGRRFRPDHSPRRGVAKALLKQLPNCKNKHCQRSLNEARFDEDRPLVSKVKSNLVQAGFLSTTGEIINPPPSGDSLEVADTTNWRRHMALARAEERDLIADGPDYYRYGHDDDRGPDYDNGRDDDDYDENDDGYDDE